MKKTTMILASVLLCTCMLSACGDSSSGDDIAMEDLPYGATLTVDKSREIGIQFDRRYLEDNLLDVIIAYHHALQTNNAEEFSACLFPLYHEYELEELYGGEVTDAAIVETSNAELEAYYGEPYAFSLIDITGMIWEDNVSPDRDALLGMLDDLAADAGQPAVSEELQALYELNITVYLDSKDSGTKSETDVYMTEALYAIHYEGKWYLIYA